MSSPDPSDIRAPSESTLERQFRGLGAGAAVTRGRYSLEGDASVEDLDWNHMDQEHRPFIHDTYHHAVRIASGQDFAVSVTRLGRTPFLAQVSDIRLGPGRFYQSVSMLGIIIVHSTITMVPLDDGRVRQDIEWLIVSRPLFRFLHGWLNRRMYRLNAVQNEEDIPVRNRRTELRRLGWSFKSDPPNFLLSNTNENSAVPPEFDQPVRIALPDAEDEKLSVREGAFEFLVKRSAGSLYVWPGVCPHEGGPLCDAALHGDKLECPWHGFRFGPIRLDADEPEGELYGLRLKYENDTLIVRPSP